MYQALYRKWRSRTFDEVIGQDHISQTLKRQVQSGRLSHAYLFVGTRGTGKTTCARILAKAINCLSPDNGNPCNKCASCVGIDNGSILDVIELDAASNNGVDNVRALREEAVFTPVDVRKRVYIIDEVHMLSTQAFNALLKILEEPPEHLIFILATTELHKVPATILSRCQRHSFKRILPADIARHLLFIAGQEGIALTEDAARLLARLADGSLRDALSLLDQCGAGGDVDYDRIVSAMGLAGSDETAGILTAVIQNDVPQALSILDRLYNDGKVMTAVLDGLQSLLRDTLLISLMPEGSSGLLSGGFDEGLLRDFAGRLSTPRLLYMSDILRETQQEIARGAGGKLAAEFCLIRLGSRYADGSPAALAERLEALEKRLSGGAAPTAPSMPDLAGAALEPGSAAAPQKPPVKTEVRPAMQPPAVQQPAGPAAQTSAAPTVQAEPPVSAVPAPSGNTDAKPVPAAAASGDLWPGILALIKPKIDLPVYHALTGQVTATATASALVLSARTQLVQNMLNKQDVAAAIREVVPQAAGKNLPVRVELAANTASAADKLDALKRFDNIKFQ
jgi:DNA polymerase-3 subunit gamma/tau